MPLPLTISCSSKSRLVLSFLVLPFWYLLTRVVLDKLQKSSKTIVCCVCVAYPFMPQFSMVLTLTTHEGMTTDRLPSSGVVSSVVSLWNFDPLFVEPVFQFGTQNDHGICCAYWHCKIYVICCSMCGEYCVQIGVGHCSFQNVHSLSWCTAVWNNNLACACCTVMKWREFSIVWMTVAN